MNSVAWGIAFVVIIASLGIVKADEKPQDAPSLAVYKISLDCKPLPEWLDNELAAMVQVGNARIVKAKDGEYYAPKRVKHD